MFYDLYHNLDPMAMRDPVPFEPCWFSQRDEHFSYVAKINAPLERIFALTNHIDEDWTNNPEVIWHALRPLRSTSIGDVIMATNPPFSSRARRSRIRSARVRLVPLHGKAWLVMPHGLKELREVSR